jgi:hypothetical protein
MKSWLLFLTPSYWKRFWHSMVALFRAICLLVHRRRSPRHEDTGCCIYLPPDVYKRADPLIYSQYYLMAQGLAVTWDNPDIDIFDGAALITGALLANHRYRVRVRVWNGSYDAPAVGVGVALSYLSFGAQTVSHPVGSTSVNLGAKATANCPAFAEFGWTTPSGEGHYCLQAQLTWADDANPDNNLGQKNVTIAIAHSPAAFEFTVRNEASVARRFVFEADCYALPRLRPCEEEPHGRDERPTRLVESKRRWAAALQEQSYGTFPVPGDWSVQIVPESLSLAPREEASVRVLIEPADLGFRGSKTFNIHTFAISESGTRDMTGGVTLTATRA